MRSPLAPLSLALSAALAAPLSASDGSTSFEDVPESFFEVGTPPRVAAFVFGHAVDPGVPELRRTGRKAWIMNQTEAGMSSFFIEAKVVELWVRLESPAGAGSVFFYDADDNLLARVPAAHGVWTLARYEAGPGDALVARAVVANSGTGRLAADDFSFTAGDLTALGTNYCDPAAPNRTGLPAVMSAYGSDVASDGDLLLVCTQLSPTFGYFLASRTQGLSQPPFSNGPICLGGDIARFQQQVCLLGTWCGVHIDLTSIPTHPPSAVQAGETWNFQFWYRDVHKAGKTTNFSDGLTLTFQ